MFEFLFKFRSTVCFWHTLQGCWPYLQKFCTPSIWWFSAVPYSIKVKAIPLQAWTGPNGSRRLRLPDFKTMGTWRW